MEEKQQNSLSMGHTLYGIFQAKSDGGKDIIPEAWNGKYPYQVEVEKIGEINSSKKIRKVFVISVVRRNQTSNTGIWHNRAIRFNFYLRGFKYLFIMRKPSSEPVEPEERVINWSNYSRKKNKSKKGKINEI